jgi:hypothetical protein
MTDEFHAVHLRHLEIADDDLHRQMRIVEQLQRLPAICRGIHRPRTEGFQQGNHRVALKVMILYDEKAQLVDLHRPPLCWRHVTTARALAAQACFAFPAAAIMAANDGAVAGE